MIVLKVGGSVLTDKTQYRKPRLDAVARVAYEVSLAKEPVVLVHGAGSFGHVLAKEKRLAESYDPSRAADLARVHMDVVDLSQLLVSALTEAGVKAVGIPPFGLSELDDGKLARFDVAPFRRALDLGLVPVTHGDVAFDRKRGGGILSGDTIVAALARELKPRVAAFATDVDGILRDGVAVPRLTSAELARLAIDAPADGRADVTGAMAGKARRILEVADAGVPVRVLNGTVAGRIALLLGGEIPLSTEVVP